jgi:hypothetical protein
LIDGLFDLEIQGSDVDDTTARNYIYIYTSIQQKERESVEGNASFNEKEIKPVTKTSS